MNLLFYLDRYPGFGGVETVTTVLSNLFVNNGYSVTIVSYHQQNLELIQQLDKKVTLLMLPNKELLSKDNQSFFVNEIIERKIDIVIHQHSYGLIFELLVAIKPLVKCKIFTVEHNTPDAQIKMYSNHLKENRFNKDWKFNIQKLFYPLSIAKCRLKERKRHQYLYEYSDRYILLSERFVTIFQEVTGIADCKKLEWIPNPLPAISECSVEHKEKIILYVGRIDKPHKRVDRLVRIFEKLHIDFPDWKLVIVGDGPYRKELEQYVTKKDIERVFFEGFQSDVSIYYRRASIVCLTSNIEGFPMVMVEAMQFGAIPFSFDSFASVYDIIKNEKTGFIIPSFNEDEYVRKLSSLMNDSKKRLLISQNAALWVHNFSKDKILLRWQKLLHQTV